MNYLDENFKHIFLNQSMLKSSNYGFQFNGDNMGNSKHRFLLRRNDNTFVIPKGNSNVKIAQRNLSSTDSSYRRNDSGIAATVRLSFRKATAK